MPNIQPIVIADGATAPASKTFDPTRPQQGDLAAVWTNKDTANPLGYRRITLVNKVRQDGGSKVDITIADPVLAIVDGACCVDKNVPAVSYTDFANISFVIPIGSTVQDRKDILAFAKNLLSNPQVIATVVNNEVIY